MAFDLIPVFIASACVSINIRELATLAATAIFLLAVSCPASLWNERLSRTYEDEKQAPNLKLSKAQAVKSFHGKRVDFLRDGFKQTGSWAFQFELLKNRVVAVSGEEGRQMLLREPGLDLYEGFQIVLESIPKGYDHHQVNSFYKRLLYLQKTDNLSSMIPYLLSDCQRKIDTWGSQGLLDPNSAIYDITFVMVMRVLNSFDITDDLALLSRLQGWFDVLDTSTEPASVYFPWIYGPASIRRLWAATNLYLTFKSFVRKRINGGTARPDALQKLIDSNQTEEYMIRLFLWQGLVPQEQSENGSSCFCHLTQSGLQLVRQEVEGLLSTYNITLPDNPCHEDLTQALSQVPLTAWETKLPSLDLCIRETMRIAQPHTALRKNTGPDFSAGEFTIPSGAFVAYSFLDTTLNPSHYADPTRWDPSRLLQKDTPSIGWGMGSHLCKGQRLAILTMKLLTASLLLRFDLSMVDEQLEKMEAPPVPNYNDQLTCQPMDKCSIKFTDRVS
ncbi:cytochrome P450 [Penicillium pulvis]|uniref:cytochrome P450 n=1 Tax=Penicillium pulvis TaxID=1562058 RepID=UPI0025468C99|nr:cytochrome P450 [Penicillium pulvis]KAJ5803569.1 cytochrome P450 [Penicillium pulvis]